MKYKRLSEIAAVLNTPAKDLSLRKFCIDSRAVEEGDVFFCLRGKNFDGHNFLKNVAAKGAIAAVVDKYYVGPTFGISLLRVESVEGAIQLLAKALQKKRQSLVIGVTGSVGKTTTKEFIATLLEGKYRVAKTPGNANSQVGLPLAILNGEGKEEVFVAEMGMSRPGELKKLVEIAPPDIAVLTYIGHAHVESFPDGREGIAREKSEIFAHPQTKVTVINKQAFAFESIYRGGVSKVSYSLDPEVADMVLKKGCFLEEWGKESPQFELPFEESHFLENFAAAATVARILRMGWEDIFSQIKYLQGFEQRFEKKEWGGALFINDCYNASPESMKAALKNLPSPSLGGKTVAVFGEMVELGGFSEGGHVEVAECALEKVDHALVFGKNALPMLKVFKEAGKPVQFFHDIVTLKEVIFELTKPGDVVLIKGSNANKLWRVWEEV